ncbi:MAG: SprB repeat-containing protein, partial [Burkholderiales bacterium]|nr:SprB repeat-containing protein [Bacteroidia bacterium]
MKKSLSTIIIIFICSFAFSQITLTSTVSNVSCFGGTNGSATVTATGGTGSYTYTWLPTNTNSDIITGLAAGTYTVNVEDAVANTSSLVVTITEPSQLLVNATTANVVCNGTSTGTINVIASGGITTYSYNINGGGYQSPSVFSNFPVGIYLMGVKDANGCVTSNTVLVNQPPQMTATITQTNVFCFGLCNGSANVSASGGIAPYTYFWSNGSTGPFASNLCFGTYNVNINDANGCVSSQTVAITQPTQLFSSSTVTNVTCAGVCNGSFNIIATGGIPPYTFSTTAFGQATNNNYNQCAGNQTITTIDANNCVFQSVITITQPQQLMTTTAATNANCGQSNGSVCAGISGGNPPYNIQWSNGASTFCNNNIPAGAYSFTVTDANGCTVVSSGLVNDIAGPNVSITSFTNVTCFGLMNGGATTMVTVGVSPYSYSWSGSATLTTSSVSNLDAGLYNVTVTDVNGCVGTQSVLISQPQQITASMSFTNASCGMCNGQIYATVMGGTPSYSFIWSPPAAGNTGALNNLCPGIYTFQVTDQLGCAETATVNIASIGSATISGITTSLSHIDETCTNMNDGSIDLTIGGSNSGPFTYQWNNGATTQDVLNLPATYYSVKIFDSAMNCLIVGDTIKTNGSNCGSISGNVFFDNNNDCIKNSGDSDLSNVQMIANPGNKICYSNWSGDYYFNNLSLGTYTITSATNANMIATCATTLNATINSGSPNSINNNFSKEYIPVTQPDLYTSAYSNGIVPGFVCRMNYLLHNYNTFNANGVFKVTLPSAFIPNITNTYPTAYTLYGDTIIWNFTNINYSGWNVNFYVDFTTPLSTPLGSTFTSCIWAQPTVSDLNYANNNYCYSRTVNGSFDPNDKTVSPVGIGANGDIAATETDLTYLIRFQNTGNGPAVNIMVKDTLSPNVNINTFEMLGASHNYNIDILPGNVLRWKFNNIMLADSGTNEPASHGYIQYRIKRTNNNAPGTQIKNTA